MDDTVNLPTPSVNASLTKPVATRRLQRISQQQQADWADVANAFNIREINQFDIVPSWFIVSVVVTRMLPRQRNSSRQRRRDQRRWQHRVFGSNLPLNLAADALWPFDDVARWWRQDFTHWCRHRAKVADQFGQCQRLSHLPLMAVECHHGGRCRAGTCSPVRRQCRIFAPDDESLELERNNENRSCKYQYIIVCINYCIEANTIANVRKFRGCNGMEDNEYIISMSCSRTGVGNSWRGLFRRLVKSLAFIVMQTSPR